MKRFILTVAIGLGAGSFAFVCLLYIASWKMGSAEQFINSMSGTDILRSALACIVVSLGFSTSSLIYLREKLPLLVQVSVHMFLGALVFFITGSLMGWISVSFLEYVLYFSGAMLSAFLIGFIKLFRLKKEAKKINEKLIELHRKSN